MRAISRGEFLLALVAAPFALAQESKPAPHDPALDWLRDYLAKSSSLTFNEAPDRQRESVSTRTQGLLPEKNFILEYERITYAADDAAQIEQRQLILYTVPVTALDATTINAQKVSDTGVKEQEYWMVLVGAKPDPGFILYDNLFESRKNTEAPDTSHSHGRVRQIVLGYFPRQELATTLAEKFRTYLGTVKAVPAPVTRPAQSDA